MLLRVASRRCAAAAARRRPLSVAAAGDDGALMDALRRCDDIYRRDVAPVNEALHGPWSTPTSPRFTVIAPGASDADQDGPALVGDPDLGFEGLRKFGPGLIQRTQLKIRSGIAPKNFMLPGTTGETLAILTNALAGQDHKLHIILNKADKFERIHDFARAYGALCWNLSKVIPRKDLPRIYTMCIPQGDAGAGGGALAAGLADLRKTRDDVLAEVRRAPSRRVDNAITRLQDAAALLLMHAEVTDAARRGRCSAARATTAARPSRRPRPPRRRPRSRSPRPRSARPALAAGCVGAAATAGLHYVNGNEAARRLAELDGPAGLDALYRKAYGAELVRGDEEANALWARVRDHLLRKLDAVGGASRVPAAPSGATAGLRRVLDHDVPARRRAAAPASYGGFPRDAPEP
ncbi:hypothetical protein JL722_476 [Aureococcus anophagefferens]|nr:hypothetical protein JL722_476 [Aureococcus anophagefferens]